MAEERTEKRRALDLAVSQIEKQFGKGSIMRLGGIDQHAGAGCNFRPDPFHWMPHLASAAIHAAA